MGGFEIGDKVIVKRCYIKDLIGVVGIVKSIRLCNDIFLLYLVSFKNTEYNHNEHGLLPTNNDIWFLSTQISLHRNNLQVDLL